MKRLLMVALLAVAASAFADDYSDGVAAIEAKNYSAAVAALQKAITQAPVETPTYLPHYWIGVAKFELGDYDGALRHWRISQGQGAVRRTPQGARLNDLVARAQAAKQKPAADDPKGNASAAMSRALQEQGKAVARGRDRSESYRNATKKLQDANAEFRKGGYAAAEKLAKEAQDLFAGNVVVVPFNEEKKTQPEVESAARAEAAVAVQKFRQRILETPKSIATAGETREWRRLVKELDRAKNDAAFQRIAQEARQLDEKLSERRTPPQPPQTDTIVFVPSQPSQPKKPSLEKAYRAYATGNLDAADAELSKIIAATPTAEAFLLRGCARYTRALLTRGKADAAVADFREAVIRDGGVRLDPSAFSPKLVSLFEQVRRSR